VLVAERKRPREICARRPGRRAVLLTHGKIAASAKRCMIGFNAGPPMMPSACHNNFQLFQTSDYDGNADAAFRICVS